MDKHDVRKGEVVTFADGVDRTIYPLTLKSLRSFIKIIASMGETRDALAMTDEDIDLMQQASAIIIKQTDPQLAGNIEKLEDAVDILVFNKLMTIAMGNSSPEV